MMIERENTEDTQRRINSVPLNNLKSDVKNRVQNLLCILYNQRDATYTMFFIIIIIISAVHVSGDFPSHYQELIKLYVQPWIFS